MAGWDRGVAACHVTAAKGHEGPKASERILSLRSAHKDPATSDRLEDVF